MFNKLLILGLLFPILFIPPILRPKTERDRRKWRIIYGTLFIILLVVGISLSEYKAIFVNAVTLCLSCIGIK